MTDPSPASNPDGGTAGPKGPPEGNALVASLRSVTGRSIGNLRATMAILSRRRSRLSATQPTLEWQLPAFLVVCLTVIAMIALDQPVGMYYSEWSGRIPGTARMMTDVGLGLWYITPGFLILIGVNQLDWGRASRPGLLTLYNWTALGFFLVIGVGLALLVANIVKRIIGRARPVHFEEHGAFTFDPFAVDASFASFPSGHSTTSGAVCAVLVLLLPRFRFLVLAFFLWIASTRIMAGVHYPSDVIAGFSFGFAFATLTALVFARLGYMFAVEPNGLPALRRSFSLWPRARRRVSAAASDAGPTVRP